MIVPECHMLTWAINRYHSVIEIGGQPLPVSLNDTQWKTMTPTEEWLALHLDAPPTSPLPLN